MPIRVIPDPEALEVAYLKAHASITPLVGTRIATELPPNPVFPFLTVGLAAGVEKDPGHLDEVYLDLSAWAVTKAEANLLIRTARAVHLDADLVSHTRGVVSNPRTVMPPRWLPDESVNPPKPRYVTTVALTIHPHPL